jgi:pSer/pThr/pTyr-binding forkhead associated (FHA) protein
MPGETRRLDENLDDERPTDPIKRRVEEAPQKALPLQLKLHVVSTGDTITVPVKSTIIIGRKDLSQRVQPDLDLTPYRGYQCGVSRSHAIIVVKDNELWVRALSGTNGTQVNEVTLTIGQEYLLRDGDELKLGVLRLKVTFVAVSAASGA